MTSTAILSLSNICDHLTIGVGDLHGTYPEIAHSGLHMTMSSVKSNQELLYCTGISRGANKEHHVCEAVA